MLTYGIASNGAAAGGPGRRRRTPGSRRRRHRPRTRPRPTARRATGRAGLDGAHADAGAHPVDADRLDERAREGAHTSGRTDEHRPASPAASSADFAPRIRLEAPLPPLELGERRSKVEPVDIAREQPAEERRDEPLGRLVLEPASEQRAERLVGGVLPRFPHQVAERPQPAAPRESGPPEEVPHRRRDAERARRERLEPAIGPRERAARPARRARDRARGRGRPPTACGRRTSQGRRRARSRRPPQWQAVHRVGPRPPAR